MRRIILLLLCFVFIQGILFPQDSTEIYFKPETAGNYTNFKTDFVNKSGRNLKKVNLEILTSGVTFKSASVAGEALIRSGMAMLDTSNYKKVDFVIDSIYYPNETVGTFKIELDGPDVLVLIIWTTYDDTQEELKSDTCRLGYSNGDTCWAISRTASAEDYIRIKGIFFTGTGFTWETWFYLNQPLTDKAIGYNMILISADNNNVPDGNGDIYLGFGHSTQPKNNLIFCVNNDIASISSGTLSAGWHHAAGVWDPSGYISVYLDGLGVTSIASTSLPFSQDKIDIGRWFGESHYFEGMIDEIRFWKTNRTHYEIISNMNECDVADNDLYAYYPVLIDEIFPPGNGYILHDVLGSLDSDPALQNHDIDWTADNAPLECCDSIPSPCLCTDQYGNPNYEIISVINHTDSSDCCWTIELDVKCDMLFINRLWFNFPAVSPLGPITAPSRWNVVPTGLGGYLTDFPVGCLPQGVHKFDMCFSSPTNPTQFPVEIHLLDYYDDNNYNEPCDPVVAKLECDSICGCEDVNLTTINKVELTDSTCCHEVTIHADCDNLEIVYLEFEYENDQISSWPIGTGWIPVSTSGFADKYKANSGLILTGDHKFMFCFPFDMHNTTIILHYKGANNSEVCPPDTFDLACGCCDKFYFNLTYRTNPLQIPHWEDDNCTLTKYTWVTIQTGPLPTTRVAMHIVRAVRTWKVLNDFGPPITHHRSVASYIVGVSTNHSLGISPEPTWNYITGGVYADIGASTNPPWLPLNAVGQSRNEAIWGGFNTSPALDMINTPYLNGYSANYLIAFKKTCDCNNLGFVIADTIKYWVRYYITDSTCCTCDTLVERKIVIPISLDTNHISAPPALITMADPTHGTLNLKLNPYNSKVLKIKLIVFEPLEDVQILSMKDPVSGNEAVIKDNIATLSLDVILDSAIYFDLNFANPNNDYMFKNKVTVFFKAYDKGRDTLHWSEEFIVTAKVPYDGDPDQIQQIALPSDRIMKTFAFQLTNLNGYKEPITKITLKPLLKDCLIEAVGRPPQKDNSVSISMLKSGDGSYVLGYNDSWPFDDTTNIQLYILPNQLFEPIIITASFPIGTIEPIGFGYETYNAAGIDLSRGEILVPTSVIDDGDGNPTGLKINCYPNPANTEVSFVIEANKAFDNISIKLTNERGEKVATVVENGTIADGMNLIPFSTAGLPSGAYYYIVKTGNYSKTKLLNIIK